MKLENTIVIGKIGSGKTTQLINMLRALLLENPKLKIGVYEECPEIKNAVPEVIATNIVSNDLDLFVFAHTNDFQLINVANSMNIPVWCEIYGDENAVVLRNNVSCIEHFNHIHLK